MTMNSAWATRSLPGAVCVQPASHFSGCFLDPPVHGVPPGGNVFKDNRPTCREPLDPGQGFARTALYLLNHGTGEKPGRTVPSELGALHLCEGAGYTGLSHLEPENTAVNPIFTWVTQMKMEYGNRPRTP